MARRESDAPGRQRVRAGASWGFAALAALLLLAAGPAIGQSQQATLESAREALQRGDAKAALSILRAFRAARPDSPRLDESYDLSIQASLAAGDDYLARFLALKLASLFPASKYSVPSCLRVAEKAYASRSYSTALDFYARAVAGFDAGAPAAAKDLALALLRCAELSLYNERDPRAAASFFHRIDPHNVAPEDMPLLRAMRVRLAWTSLSPQKLGLPDGNVSALRVDEDDLWVGTWNGGVARYAISADRSDAFPVPAYPRTIEVAGRRIWVGSTDGLSWYGKASGTWKSDDAFQVPAQRKVQSLKLLSGVLYAGTLGDGLFRLALQEGRPDSPWTSVSDGELPGAFVTCIEEARDGASLYLGTLNLGLVIMDCRTGSMKSLAEIATDFSSPNVTSVHEDADGRVWVATYGDGLYVWMPKQGTIRHFSKATGELGDDWVLAICETSRAVYFGTFGGGASVFRKSAQGAKGAWRRIGIADGLGSLDVSAIAGRAPYVFFGTLGAGVSVYDEEADGP